jgi:hypothetical protein
MRRIAALTARRPRQVALLMEQYKSDANEVEWLDAYKAKAAPDFTDRARSIIRSLAPKLFREGGDVFGFSWSGVLISQLLYPKGPIAPTPLTL